MKLKSKTIVQYKGEVVDLRVENSHTYNVEGVGVHNSGGGSLVAYVLYITDLDPLRWDLPFSRFLSVHRKGAPDIDTDLANRDKVLEQLRNFFGFENVVPISNYNTFKLKTLVKDIGKFYGVPFEETNAATRTVEEEVRKATMKEGMDKNLFVLVLDEAMQYSPSFKAFIDKHPEVAESIKVLFKQNRSLGRHAGGVLIADDLPNKMPLITSGGEPQTPWVEGVNFKHLEYIGNFIKYDLLGLETLRLIERTIELILMKGGNVQPTFTDVKRWFDEHMSLDVIDFDDQKPFEVYSEGLWAGIFQCTGQGAQRLFKKAKPKSVIDIAALTSIYRPGPLAAKVDKLWLEHEETPYDWGHPLINETLKETRGLLVFQEGVMSLVNRVSGFPMAETDEVRRAIMKRSISGGEAAKKKTQELEDSVIKGAVKNGVPHDTAKKMYETICFMSGYGFNKSHAVAYAIDSFWCAWLMTYHREEWLCAYLEAMSTTPEKRERAFAEVKQLGYEIVGIDVEHASLGWVSVPGKRLMPSMTSVKGVGDGAVQEVIEGRPHEGIEGFLWKDNGEWRHTKFNRKSFEALVRIRAFDSLGCVGEGKVFRSYRHMHHVMFGDHTEAQVKKKKLKASELEKVVGCVSAHTLTSKVTGDVIIQENEPFTLSHLEALVGEGVKEVEVSNTRTVDHQTLLKKHSPDDPHAGRKHLYELARSTWDAFPEWSRQEIAGASMDLFGSLDVNQLVGPDMVKRLQEKGIRSIDEWSERGFYWFVSARSEAKKTKNGKGYLDVTALGPIGKDVRIRTWSYDGKRVVNDLSVCVAEVDKNDFGFSTSMNRLKDVSS